MWGIKSNPDMWLIFDEPEDYTRDEQDETCKTYHYNNRLHVLTIYNRLINAYLKSRKTSYKLPIKLRKTNA